MLNAQRIALLPALAVAALALGSCAGTGSDKAGGQPASKPVVLTLAFFSGEDEVDRFITSVRRLSGGAIVIDLKANWRWGQAAYETGLIADVRSGKVDLGVVGSRAWDSVGVDSFRALDAPMLIDSYALQDRVLASPLIDRMLKGLAPLGLAGLGVLPGPLRRPAGILRPLLGPSDYAGLRIGTQESLVAGATLRSLGAKPVWLPAGGPSGGVDGVEEQISSINGPQYRDVRYVTANVVLWPRPLVVFTNQRALAKLTPAQRHILVQAAAAAEVPQTAFERQTDQTDTAAACRAHQWRLVSATSSDLAALRRAVQPVYAELDRDRITASEIAEVEALGRTLSPEPAERCPQSISAAVAAGPLDGVYRYSITLAEVKAAGGTPDELDPTSVGNVTFVIDRGHFAMTTENPRSCTWAYGTLTISGDKLFTQFYTDAGGGPAPTPNLFDFRWSLYRDQLRLSRLPGAASPTQAIAEPWHRVSTTPSWRYFSERCPPPASSLPR